MRKAARTISIIILLLQVTMLSSCTPVAVPAENKKIKIVCTVFPQYDWVRQILGDEIKNTELILLLDSRIDLHSYQPTIDSIAQVSSCDLLIYVGGESDKWIESVIKEAVNKNMHVINLLEALGDYAKAEEIIEGMERDRHEHDPNNAGHCDDHDMDELHLHDEECEHHESDNRDTDHDEILDEHVWLSMKNAKVLCSVISEKLSLLNSENAALYQSNLTAYLEKLSALDKEYQMTVDAAPFNALLFADRFPFRYLLDDYGINYYAAFPGCSAEAEAGFNTIVFLATKIDEFGFKCVLVTDSSNNKLADTVIRESKSKNQKILVMDSMQSVSQSEIANGATFLSIMEKNLNVLKEALN